MSSLSLLSTTAEHARSAGYDVVLLAHVLTALVGLGAVTVAGGHALVLGRRGPESDSLRRYYRPGPNWAGRVLIAVPLLGIALVAMSQGDWTFADPWISSGLAAWAVAAGLAEAVLWPAERRIQVAVAGVGDGAEPSDELRSLCSRVVSIAGMIVVVLVAATVVMVAKP